MLFLCSRTICCQILTQIREHMQQLLADIRRMNRVLVPRGLCLLPIRSA